MTSRPSSYVQQALQVPCTDLLNGMPTPDLTRAYMWYTLSAIGGDPDAAISLEEVIKKMTPEQIEKAHILVADYRAWMYPFR